MARVLAGYKPRSLRDSGERKPHDSAPAEVGVHKPCQVKNSAAGLVNEPKLKNLPGSPKLSNAPVLAFSRTIMVRFFKMAGRASLSRREFSKKTPRKKSALAENYIGFLNLTLVHIFSRILSRKLR